MEVTLLSKQKKVKMCKAEEKAIKTLGYIAVSSTLLIMATVSAISSQLNNIVSVSALESSNVSVQQQWGDSRPKYHIEVGDTYASDELILSSIGTKEELDLFYRVIEAEVGSYYNDFNAKCNVASVIINRLEWGSLSGILNAEQFETVRNGSIHRVEPTSINRDAVLYVLKNGDTTGGAYFFDSTKGNSWASENKEYIFTDGVGHDFYK